MAYTKKELDEKHQRFLQKFAPNGKLVKPDKKTQENLAEVAKHMQDKMQSSEEGN